MNEEEEVLHIFSYNTDYHVAIRDRDGGVQLGSSLTVLPCRIISMKASTSYIYSSFVSQSIFKFIMRSVAVSEEFRSMFQKAGLEEVQNLIDRRLQVNRGRQLKMYRVWLQCKYRKPLKATQPDNDSSIGASAS
eukprot:GHVL01035195.1.p2 GENE.GHVL01035195.1~~GHVL01035195.1.p2  ORF type:complete len:134 (-),score=5.29 GHVL01035195.1:1824-2225(-)